MSEKEKFLARAKKKMDDGAKDHESEPHYSELPPAVWLSQKIDEQADSHNYDQMALESAIDDLPPDKYQALYKHIVWSQKQAELIAVETYKIIEIITEGKGEKND